jgi:hypothetical protein
MHKNGIKQLLREFCDGPTKRYVDQHLKLLYQVGLGPGCLGACVVFTS